MLGVKCNNRFRITVQRCLAPNIGLEEFWSLHDSGVSKTHTCRSGWAGEIQRGRYL